MLITEIEEVIIDRIVEIFLQTVWRNKLGRLLIRKREMPVSHRSLKKVKKILKENFYQIIDVDRIIVPIGSLNPGSENPEKDFHLIVFYKNDPLKFDVIFPKIDSKEIKVRLKLDNRRSYIPIIYWFRDLKICPRTVEKDIMTFKDKINKRG